MLPPLLTISGVAVGWHNVFVVLGALAATAVYFWEARRRGVLSEDVAVIALGTLAFGVIAARLSSVLRDGSTAADPPANWAYSGMSILGGLAGAYVGAILTKRWLGYRSRTGDLFAPAVALGMAIGRWGCFLTEEPGTPTSLPWGIRVSAAAAARIPDCEGCLARTAMHPSFLYEIAFHAVMFVLLLRLRGRVRSNGSDLLKIYLLAYAVFRFLVEFVRGNDPLLAGLSRSQLFLIPTSALLVAYFVRRSKSAQIGAAELMPAEVQSLESARRRGRGVV